jgi:hypothetical protein
MEGLEDRDAMYCQDLISEDDLREFLNWAIINKEDIAAFADAFEGGSGEAGEKTEYIVKMFLLYNEYLGSDWKYQDIAKYLNIMKFPYAAIRPKFVRDGIITLDLGSYSSVAAIDEQITALDNIIDSDEKNFIKSIFDNDGSIKPFFRMPNDDNTAMQHAEAEKTNYLSTLSKILNCRYSDQVLDKSKITEKNRDILESIFEKIRSGTIH